MTCIKRHFPTRVEAKKELKRIKRVAKRGESTPKRIYYCNLCGSWHFTSSVTGTYKNKRMKPPKQNYGKGVPKTPFSVLVEFKSEKPIFINGEVQERLLIRFKDHHFFLPEFKEKSINDVLIAAITIQVYNKGIDPGKITITKYEINDGIVQHKLF